VRTTPRGAVGLVPAYVEEVPDGVVVDDVDVGRELVLVDDDDDDNGRLVLLGFLLSEICVEDADEFMVGFALGFALEPVVVDGAVDEVGFVMGLLFEFEDEVGFGFMLGLPPTGALALELDVGVASLSRLEGTNSRCLRTVPVVRTLLLPLPLLLLLLLLLNCLLWGKLL